MQRLLRGRIGRARAFTLTSGVVATLAVVLTIAPVSAASTWKVDVGAQTQNKAIQANFFGPTDIWVDDGDMISWTSRADEIHTVTFLGGQARPALFIPNPSGPGIVANPPAVAPTPNTVFNGTGFTNSGLLAGAGQSYSLKIGLPSNQTSATFGYVCLVHEDMTGTVHVQAKGTPLPRPQGFYTGVSRAEGARLTASGLQLEAEARANGIRHPGKVTAGIGELFGPGNGSVAVMRMLPDKTTVHVGQTVTWTNHDPETPHTVTFGTEPPGGPFGAFLPSANVHNGAATVNSTSDSINSGYIGMDPHLFGDQFSVRFASPGVYPYICALHDDLGMVGQITVLP